MCTKVQFSKREAKTALNQLKKVRKKYRKEIRAYHCPNCNHWHLTSQEPN